MKDHEHSASFSRLADSIPFTLSANTKMPPDYFNTHCTVSLTKLNKQTNKHKYEKHTPERLKKQIIVDIRTFPHFTTGYSHMNAN
jgi:hypothetical protein